MCNALNTTALQVLDTTSSFNPMIERELGGEIKVFSFEGQNNFCSSAKLIKTKIVQNQHVLFATRSIHQKMSVDQQTNNMMDTYEESRVMDAVRLNNDAVRQAIIGSSNDDQSIVLFSKSLTVFRSLISQDTSSSSSITIVDADDDEDDVQPILHSSTIALPKFGEKSFFLFSSLIELADIMDTHASFSADNHVYCAAIILNIAIIHHRHAVSSYCDGQQDFSSLMKAERFYDMVIKILSGSNTTDPERGTALMIKLAAVNNLAQIKFEEGDYQAAEEGFQLLAWMVSSIPAASGANGNGSLSILNAQQLEGMLLNVLMSNSKTAAAAA